MMKIKNFLLTRYQHGAQLFFSTASATKPADPPPPTQTECYIGFHTAVNQPSATLYVTPYLNGKRDNSVKRQFTEFTQYGDLSLKKIYPQDEFNLLKIAFTDCFRGYKAAYVFYIGYDKDTALALIREGHFSKIVTKAVNLYDIYKHDNDPTHPIEVIENPNFDPTLHVTDTQHREYCRR